MNFVFLYTELADYVVYCMNKLAERGNEVYVVRWEVNAEAPFQFKTSKKVKLYSRNDYQTKEELLGLINQIQPSKIICSGWVDKLYLQICKVYYKKVPTILTLDNHWTGSPKQRLATLASPFLLRTKFSHAWVPGDKQYKYALKLGFDSTVIRKGFYCANAELFSKMYKENKESKKELFPHVFLYVGRYVKHKGIFDLWEAFIEFQDEQKTEWELWCVGTGDQYENRREHAKIRHFGFVQPDDMPEIVEKSGVYILPSHFEPWGVTLQEFSLAGFPLLCSDKVGASELFLEENINGFSFESGNKGSIKKAFKKVLESSNNKLFEMHKKSNSIGLKINPDLWIENLMEFK